MTAEPKPISLVLIADDSLVVRSLLRRQLEEHGHQVVEAVDGQDAIDRCRDERPDMVLLDVEMPRLDGYEVLALMQADHELARIPVVFLTGRSSTDDVVTGLRLGAHDYLRKPFDPAELVARVSAALRMKHLQDELRHRNAELDEISRMDVLTGLPNRRHLQEHLQSESISARRHGDMYALLMIDIDHFKTVNDTFGHETGDDVLRIVALRLADTCREADVAGRWGGEEFLVIAPATDLAAASALAERIRIAIADHRIGITEGRSIPVTVSIGVASGTGDVDPLLRSADRAMYDAKELGRDRVALAPDLPDSPDSPGVADVADVADGTDADGAPAGPD